MKRWIALGVSALGVLVAAARPVAALPDARPRVPLATVPPDAVSVALSKVDSNGLALTLDAGASANQDLVVSNHTQDLRLTVKLVPTDAAGNLGKGAAAWVGFADDVVVLDPHAATTVPMGVTVPHDTQPGPSIVHVVASVESAVAAADGTPVAGSATVTFPVSIVVNGAPTAQVAVADVHRIDHDTQNQLALVLRNFANAATQVSGQLRVVTGQPQTIPIVADLQGARDTTLLLDWKATSPKVPTEIAVDLSYNGGNTASWSSTLGGPPTTIATPQQTSPAQDVATPTSVGSDQTGQTDQSATNATAPSNGKDALHTWMPVLIVLAILAAAAWFFFELRRSRRAGPEIPMFPGMFMPPGWAPPSGVSSDAAAELAKQLVRLTEIIVELSTNSESRARSPDPPTAWPARAGPAADDRGPPAWAPPPAPPTAAAEPAEPIHSGARSASPTAGAEARPETDPREDAMRRLMELDRQRRELRAWMDAEEAEVPDAPPPEPTAGPAAPEAEPQAPEPDPVTAELMRQFADLERRRRELHSWMDAEDAGGGFAWAGDDQVGDPNPGAPDAE